MGNRIVIGAGKYGINYARILAEHPDTDTLILTRTTLQRAEQTVEQLRSQENCKTQVIGEQVSSLRELKKILDQYQPDFVGITSKDPVREDSIHVNHTRFSLEHESNPFVLCEKPFSNASGNGVSLNYLRHLIKNPNLSDRFDLQLPVATIMRSLVQDPEFSERFQSATDIEVYWAVNKPERKTAINDLSSHAWCIPSERYSIEKVDGVEIANGGQCAKIKTRLRNETKEGIPCTMALRYDQNLRGFRIDACNIIIQTVGSINRVLHINGSLDEIVECGGIVGKEKIVRTIAVVENPLRMNIESAISRKPVNSISRIYDSQLFLERVWGYKDN